MQFIPCKLEYKLWHLSEIMKRDNLITASVIFSFTMEFLSSHKFYLNFYFSFVTMKGCNRNTYLII